MPVKKYEDFLDMNIKDLQDYFAVRDLNTYGRKIKLIARAFAALELKIEIKSTSEDQRKRLETEYLQNIRTFLYLTQTQLKKINGSATLPSGP